MPKKPIDEITEIIRTEVEANTIQLDPFEGAQVQQLGFAIRKAAATIASEIESGEGPFNLGNRVRDKVSYLLPEKGTVLAINADSTREALQSFLNTFVFKDGAKCVVDRVDPASNGGLAILFHSAPTEKDES